MLCNIANVVCRIFANSDGEGVSADSAAKALKSGVSTKVAVSH